MNSEKILGVFIVVKMVNQALKTWIIFVNRKYYSNVENQQKAHVILDHIPTVTEIEKNINYNVAIENNVLYIMWIHAFYTITLLYFGIYGWIERQFEKESEFWTGICFFTIDATSREICKTYFNYKEKRLVKINITGAMPKTAMQSLRSLIFDIMFETIFTMVFYGVVLYVLSQYREYLWLLPVIFYPPMFWGLPMMLHPLLHKLEDDPLFKQRSAELKADIDHLTEKTGIKVKNVYILNKSADEFHSNAFMMGFFKTKKIVLCDELVKKLTNKEIIGVVAHELGHFKLNHIMMKMCGRIVEKLFQCWLLNQCIQNPILYDAFHLKQGTIYGGLLVFNLWWNMVKLYEMPVEAYLSRQKEFAADAFAVQHADRKDFQSGLLKIYVQNHSMPVSHPIYSVVYNSHPPLIERFQAMDRLCY